MTSSYTFDPFLQPLRACRTANRWSVQLDNNPPIEAVQTGASFFTPDEISEFLKAAHAALLAGNQDDPELQLPAPKQGMIGRFEPRIGKKPFTDPLLSIMYQFWESIDVMANAKLDRRKTPFMPAWDWWVFYQTGSDQLEGAFKMYGPKMEIVPNYDLDRRPLDELITALNAGRDLVALMKSV